MWISPRALGVAVALLPAPALAQLALPYSQGFEDTGGVTLQADTAALPGAPEWAFTTDTPGQGRLRTAAGFAFTRSGFGAATLDRTPSGSVVVNHLVGTFDLSAHSVASGPAVLLRWSVMDHGEEPHPNDRVWVRGAAFQPWVEVADLTTPATPNGIYVDAPWLDVSAALAGAGQTFSTTTQVRFGQEDNFAALVPEFDDGLTFDDVAITLDGPSAGVLGVVEPLDGACGDAGQMITVRLGAGSVDISGIPVQVDVSGDITASFTTTVATTIGADGSDLVSVGPVDTSAGGIIDITVTASLPGDVAPGDDVLTVTGVEIIGGPVPIASAPAACPGYPAELAVSPEFGQFYAWYDDAAGTTQVGSGPSFTTPAVPAGGASYWVHRVEEDVAVGPATITIGPSSNYTFVDNGLIFDVVGATVTIEEMTVHPQSPGDVVVTVLTGDGDVVATDTIPVTSSSGTPTSISTSLVVPPGDGYILSAAGTTTGGLYRNSAGASYPYTDADGIIEVTGNTRDLPAYWYFFYDIEGTVYPCAGGPTEVVVAADPAGCEADLTLSLTEPAGPLVAGSSAAWTVDVTNNGPHDATGVALDAVPDPLGLFGANAGDCSAPFACALPDLAPGGSAQVVSSWDVDPSFDPTGLFEQTFSVTAAENDPAPGDESATSSLPVGREVDLSVSLRADPDPPFSGSPLTYIAQVINAGPSDTDDATATLTLPAGWSVEASTGCVEDPGGGAPCTVANVPGGGAATLAFVVQVPLEQADPFEASVEVTSLEPDAAPGDESATLVLTPQRPADLALALDDDVDPAFSGGALTYTAVVSNRGPAPAEDVVLQMTAPDGFEPGAVPECDASLRCELGGIAAGADVTVEVSGLVSTEGVGIVEFLGAVTAAGTDPNPDDNTAREDTALVARADLSLSGSVTPAAVAPGEVATVLLAAANAGPSYAAATLEITLPGGVDVDDAGPCAPTDAGLSCPAELAASSSRDIAVVLAVPADAPSAVLSIDAELVFGGEEAAPGDEAIRLSLGVQGDGPIGDDDDAPDDPGCDCAASLAGPSGSPALLLLLAGARRRRARAR